jgi:hypothetical protein
MPAGKRDLTRRDGIADLRLAADDSIRAVASDA